MHSDLKSDLKPHVLLVEDELIIQKVNRYCLEELGCVVTVAQNGHEAVQLCQKNVFSLVLMDIHMPVMDGLEATACIRHLGQEVLPVIAFTTDVSERTRVACQQAGMNEVVQKPMPAEGLQALLNKYFVNVKKEV